MTQGVSAHVNDYYALELRALCPDAWSVVTDYACRTPPRTITAGTATTETYTYEVASNRLETVFDGTDTRNLTYDPAGNTTGDDAGGGGPVLGLGYNHAGRLTVVSDGGGTLAAYEHNPLGQRVLKDESGAVTVYQYDRGGALIAEHSAATSAPLRETIRLGGMPLAVVDHSGASPVMYFVHPDHLGSPQKMTDAAMSIVWDGQFRPFGEEHLITGAPAQNDRFPGQRLEPETGYSYNYFRDYDPATGRYLQSDPIGLLGGLNTYAYVGGNPINLTDPTGEFLILTSIAVGLVVSLAIETAVQVGVEGRSLNNLDPTGLIIAGVSGAVAGSIAGKLLGTAASNFGRAVGKIKTITNFALGIIKETSRVGSLTRARLIREGIIAAAAAASVQAVKFGITQYGKEFGIGILDRIGEFFEGIFGSREADAGENNNLCALPLP